VGTPHDPTVRAEVCDKLERLGLMVCGHVSDLLRQTFLMCPDQLATDELKLMTVTCLIPMQKGFQIVKTKGAANRDRLRCITCPKLTIRVAANSP
jgi:hypothetical protein